MRLETLVDGSFGLWILINKQLRTWYKWSKTPIPITAMQFDLTVEAKGMH